MILGRNRLAVIENIRHAAQWGDFHAKVEIDDPILTPQQCRDITDRYLAAKHTFPYRFHAFLTRHFANIGSDILNRHTEIKIEGELPPGDAGYLLTSNHFCPLENTVIRHFVRKQGKKRLNVIAQMVNFAMKGPIGYLLRYADTIPLLEEPRYLSGAFLDILAGLLEKKQAILIYPEQEMWFNYRKPRPLKRGAYYFAAKLNAPVVCCFVEMVDLPQMDTKEFRKVRYVLHILGTLYPDPEKSVRQNSMEMCRQDLLWKQQAYEAAYGKPLTYDFTPQDIAGWAK